MRRVTYLLVCLVLGACSSGGDGDDGGDGPSEGNSFLTIVGDPNVTLEAGRTLELRVKYHDQAGDPLAGEVSFQMSGMTGGSTISAAADVTDANGHAGVLLTTGSQQVSFRVVAAAEYANPVEWRITVGGGLGPLDVIGTYALDSQFDLSNLPGDAGGAVNTFVEMTDDPNDPATWVLDQMVDTVDSSFIRGVINAFRPALDAYLNPVLISASPNLITMLQDVGGNFAELSRKFGMRSRLTVSSAGQVSATHLVTGLHWTIDGTTYEYTAADIGLGEVKADNIAVMLMNNKVTIAEHTLPMKYGTVLAFILNRVVIPSAMPFADSLEDVLVALIDCDEIAWRVYVETGTGTESMYKALCMSALGAASDALEDQLRNLDEGSALVLHGDAVPSDTNADRKIDKLTMGFWEGSFRIGGSPAPLARPDHKFLGERMPTP